MTENRKEKLVDVVDIYIDGKGDDRVIVEKIVARVPINRDLDGHDGQVFCDGARGHHRGLVRLEDGFFALIRESEEETYACVVSMHMAVLEICGTGRGSYIRDNLLSKFGLNNEFKELKKAGIGL